jgi:hypothetical protein
MFRSCSKFSKGSNLKRKHFFAKRKFKATGNVNAVLLDYGIPDGTNKMF